MAAPGLVLRDIHQPPPPPWWPPAPGWWLLVALLLLAIAAVGYVRLRRHRRRARLLAVFDQTVAAASTPPQQVAAMSELLRRAGRRLDPQADRLQDQAWLAFLDAGSRRPLFDGEHGRLLLDGGYRPQVDPGAADALRERARTRFLEWMDRR